jgi:VWFA-related protein
VITVARGIGAFLPERAWRLTLARSGTYSDPRIEGKPAGSRDPVQEAVMSALAVAILLAVQAPAAEPKAAVGTEIRALTVTLVDDKGQDVTDVSVADVALAENGVHRDIASFARDTRPLAVAILVDTSAAVSSAYRLNVVDAVVGLVARLPEGARYAIWTTGDRPTKLVDYTDDRGAAGAVLRRVAPQGGNYTLDALAEATRDLAKLAREGDRKAVVAVTGEGPEFSYRDKQRAAEEAEGLADIFLSVQVDVAEADFDTRTRLSYALERLATASGGRADQVLSYMALDSALKKLSAHLASAFRLRYATVPELKKRKLELSVARPGTRVVIPQLVAQDKARAES